MKRGIGPLYIVASTEGFDDDPQHQVRPKHNNYTVASTIGYDEATPSVMNEGDRSPSDVRRE